MLPYYVPPKRRKGMAPPTPVIRSLIAERTMEVLTGYVQGKKASDLEERAANSHYTLGISFTFRARISIFPIAENERPMIEEGMKPDDWVEQYNQYKDYTPVLPLIPFEMAMNYPGELEIDILADRKGQLWPILIDGEISHYMSTSQQDVDRQKTDAINIALAPYGARAVVRVPYTLLRTQEASDEYFRNLYQELA